MPYYLGKIYHLGNGPDPCGLDVGDCNCTDGHPDDVSCMGNILVGL